MPHQNRILKDYKRLHLLYKKGATFVAFDTETTGIHPSQDRIIELGAIKFNKNGIIGSWSSLFYPQCEIPEFVENLTKITNELVKDKPLISTKLPDFYEFISDSIFVAHNVQVDLNFINAELSRCNLPLTKNKAIDTLQFSIYAYPDLEKHKLDFLADYFKINKGSSHRALDDANTCMEIFKKLISRSL